MKVAAKPRFLSKTEVPVVSVRKDIPVCKNCKEFTNKPGYCKLHKRPQARKKTCEDFSVGK